MKCRYPIVASLLCSALSLLSPKQAFGRLNYEAYLESWDPNYTATITGLPAGPNGEGAYAGVTVDIAFAELDISTSGYFRGLGFSSNVTAAATAVNSIVTAVHSAGSGKVKISFGGQANNLDNKTYWFQATPGFPSNAVSLATGLAAIFNSGNYPNLNGLDFDIEEKLTASSVVTHAEFATYLLTFFQTLRGAIASPKIISITIPGQAWPATWETPPAEPASYWQIICQAFFTTNPPYTSPNPYFGLVDYVNIMEYPLQIIGSNSYTYSQIAQDINYYLLPITQTAPGINHPGWGLPSNKIQLGLCVASCCPGQTLLPSDMQKLSQAANSPSVSYNQGGFGAELGGVMIWDLSLDAQPTRANPPAPGPVAPYAYSQAVRLGITQTLPPSSIGNTERRNQSYRAGAMITSTRYGEPVYTTPTAFPNTINP